MKVGVVKDGALSDDKKVVRRCSWGKGKAPQWGGEGG